MRTLWARRFMALAELVAGWSKDPSTKVGAVLVKDRTVVATGYNGFPKGVPDSPILLHDRDEKYPRIVHAEMNAILQAGHRARGATLYLVTLGDGWDGGGPCANCCKHLIQAGVEAVVCWDGPSNDRWSADCNIGVTMLEQAGVTVMHLPRE